MTHCLFAYLMYPSESLWISQPSFVSSHSLMINRAAVPASPLTATCKLVTLNDSQMHASTHTRGRWARRVCWSRVFCENREEGGGVEDSHSSFKDSAQRNGKEMEQIMLTLDPAFFPLWELLRVLKRDFKGATRLWIPPISTEAHLSWS